MREKTKLLLWIAIGSRLLRGRHNGRWRWWRRGRFLFESHLLVIAMNYSCCGCRELFNCCIVVFSVSGCGNGISWGGSNGCSGGGGCRGWINQTASARQVKQINQILGIMVNITATGRTGRRCSNRHRHWKSGILNSYYLTTTGRKNLKNVKISYLEANHS